MGTMASQIISITIIVYSNVYSGANQRKHQSFSSLAYVRVIHWWPVNSPHKGPVTREMFPFDDVIMGCGQAHVNIKVIPIFNYLREYQGYFQILHMTDRFGNILQQQI